ncbi:PEP-CTERM sorting domain-containing protein [Loktanella sp. DJP18]|uniref:PEP-CTERM sorting domain-containing protein n=1 Tax=Loktanella sp. DJP18 TaxID=3409788 RepID=UPI003BB4A554
MISFLYNFSDNAKGITGPGILTLTYAGLGSPINLPGSKDGNTFEFDTAIEDIASFTLSNTGDGVIRLGGIETTISAVPVPASGLLLLGALGLMASRRRKTAA